MLETMADSAQLPAPGLGDAEAASKPGEAAADAKALPTGDVPLPLPADAPGTPAVAGTSPGSQGIGDLAHALPVPAAASALVQLAADKPATSQADAESRSDAPTAEADAALALLQQTGVPDAKQATTASKKEESTSPSLLKADGPDAGDQPAPTLAPEVAPQVAAGVPVPAAPAAGSTVPVENTAQAPAVATTLPLPAFAAFQPAAPRPASPSDAKQSKHADRSEPLPATQTADPEGILPPADKPDAAAAIEHKGEGAPALQHRSPAELLKAFSETRPSTPDQLSGQTTFTDNSDSATLATGSHATIVSGASATASAQNQLQPQQLVPLSGVPVLIASRALAGDKHIDIRLDPPELGRIEVRLKVDHEGQISSHLIADRPDTLALLRRDGAGLERALQDAGFKTAGEGLQFSLRDQSGNGQPDARSTRQPLAADQDTNTRLDTVPSSYMRYSGRVGGLDIRV